MGIASSSNSASNPTEGEHFVQLVNPQRARPPTPSAAKNAENLSKEKEKKLGVDPRARILRRLSHDYLWNGFLDQGFQSFALTHAELQSVLEVAALNSVLNPHNTEDDSGDATVTKSKVKSEQVLIDQEIKDFLALLGELETSKVVDFMAVCSATLFLSDIQLETKIDRLFYWIALPQNESVQDFCYEDFLVAISSFERGLSNAIGRQHCSESFIKTTAYSWWMLADPQAKGPIIKITSKQFFEFCTNRQHVVRRLLEALSTLELLEDKNMELQEINNDAIENLISPPGGDEWMANPAWKKTAEKMIPPGAKEVYRNAKPQSNLELEWVHGYRGYDCRNNIFYLNPHQIVFTAAALCIVQVQRGNQKSQFYFSEHSDDILSIATAKLDERATLIATGEIGKTPAVYVYSWTSNDSSSGGSFQSLACLRGCHSKGVSQLAFSSDGKYLFSIGVEYTIAIYCTDRMNTKNFGKMIASSQGPKDRLMHGSFVAQKENKYIFATCGEKHAVIWKFDCTMGLLTQETVRLGPHKNKVLLCVVSACGDGALFSTSEGELLFAKEGVAASAIDVDKASFTCHNKSAINALWKSDDGSVIVSGDKEGKLVGWHCPSNKLRLEARWEFIITGYNESARLEGLSGALGKAEGGEVVSPKPPAIRAVALESTLQYMLVGTQRCELIQYAFTQSLNQSLSKEQFQSNLQKSDILVSGHFQDEVWGLAVRPSTELSGPSGIQYATVGDDGYLRIWDLNKHSLIKCVNLQGIARCCAYSPDGLYLAIGFGAGKNQAPKGGKAAKTKEDGMVKVIRFDYDNADPSKFELTQVAEIREAKQWISVVKFSPDGTLLAVGSRDNSIYLYSVPNQFKRKIKFSKHNAGIAQFDFSACGKYIQSCCSAYEILFFEVQTGAQLTNGATKLSETEWHTWTCTLGWPVIGIWSGSMDGSDINNVDRSPSGRYIATCDDFGKVNIFQYPALEEKGALCNSYAGHSSHVTCCRWISRPSSKKRAGKTKTDDFLISIGGEDKCVFQWKHTDSFSKREEGEGEESKDVEVAPADDAAVDEFEAPSGGDEFMAVKPWLGAIVAPTAWANPDPGKLPALYASLSEYANALSIVNQSDEIPSADAYEGLISTSEVVLRRMYDSGFLDPSPPSNDELELEWVHGYRGFDCRNNTFYIKMNERTRYILYYAAALGILMDPKTKQQRYFKGHSDDIVSMAIHRNGTPESAGQQVVVASGQQGISNVYVWEVPSMQTLAIVETKQKNLHLVAFSGDGRLVISIGQDLSIVVSDWKSSTLLATAKMENSTMFHMAVMTSPPVSTGKNDAGTAASSVQFLTCGDKVLRLWSINGRNITSKKYTTTGGPKNVTAKLQHFLCAEEIGGVFYVGCEDGSVYVIPVDGTSVKAVLSPQPDAAAAKGKKSGGNSITAISKFVNDTACWLLCGAKDGSVLIWNAAGDKSSFLSSFQIGTIPGLEDIMAKQIQSISMISQSTQPNKFFMTIGTRGCDLLELEIELVKTDKADDQKKFEVRLCVNESKCQGIITRGHCNEELWGIATHPTRPQYCSVGDDKTLRFYDVHSRSMLLAVPLGHISRTVAYSHDGNMLALGFGGRVGKGKETGGGIVRIYSVSQTTKMEVVKVAERQDAKQWISDVKFSNDSRVLVAGAHDCKIYIYNVVQKDGKVEMQLRHTFGKHNSVINHVDLSNDGRYMQSNCSAYELLFCETGSGRQITAASELKDVKWQTWTCTLGWPVQGIWKSGMDGSDINAVCRSNSGHLLVTSDDFGKVNLYRYPVVDTTNSKCLSYSGHSSHVMNIRWTCGDECLISAGGNDKCLLQWRHRITDSSFLTSSSSGGKSEKKVQIAEDSPEEVAAGEDMEGSASDDLMHGPGGGDESGAVKPWLGAVRPPKNPPPISSQAPTVDINLTWIHGYSCSAPSQRNNLFYNLGHKLIYPAASLAVLLDRSADNGTTEWKQQYFQGHDDDVLCIAMSRDRRYIATGQIASKALKGKASVIVWDALQCRLLSRMESCHQRGVLSLAFNDTGNQLISVGMDDSFTHILWSDLGGSWSRVQQLASAKGDKTPTLFAAWVTSANATLWTDCQFITGGVRSMSLWKIEGASLTKKQTKLGKKVQASTYLSMANLHSKDGWKVYFGTSNGDLLVLENRELQLCVEKAHEQAIQALAVNAEGSFMVSGGKDGSIKMWNQSLQMTSYFELKDASITTHLPLFDRGVVAVDICPNSTHSSTVLALGTAGGDLLEIVVPPLQTKSTKAASASEEQSTITFDFSKAQISRIISSHTKGELWGLAVHPTNHDIYATVGDDKLLRLWSIKHNRCVHAVALPRASRCLAWNPQGSILAVGLEEKKGAGKGKGKGGKGGGKNAPKDAEVDDDGGNSKTEDHSAVSVLLYAVKIPHLKSSSSKQKNDEDMEEMVEVILKATGCSVQKGSEVSAFPSVADIKFSNKKYLCIAPKDCKMYCYLLPETTVDANSSNFPWDEVKTALQTPYYILNKHSSMVTHFDFSLDEQYIQSNDLGNELLFYDLLNKKQEPSASKLADYNGDLEDDEETIGKQWASQTCIFGWSVQGIWPPNAYDSSEINSVDRHHSKKYLATAEDSGQIRVLRFPSVTPNSSSVVLKGHSSHVTNVRWSVQHLISAGGNDKCVFVWEMAEK